MKKLILLMCVAAAGAVLPGCSDESGGKIKGIIDVPTTENITLSRAEEDVNECINNFAFDLLNAAAENYDQAFTNKDDENLAISPMSAAMCLAVLANSGDKTIETSICKALGYDDLETINSACNKLMQFVHNGKGGCELSLANSVWYDQKYKVSEEYINLINNTFYAEAGALDFNDYNSTCETIDKWCAAKTRGYIEKLSDIMCFQDLVLANALYFNGKWLDPFEKSNTKRKNFYGTNGTTIVEMMETHQSGSYHKIRNAEAVAIPFKGDFEMVFVLPDEGISANELSKTLTADDWNSKTTDETTIGLEVPKFKLETGATLDNILNQLGIDLICKFEKMGLDTRLMLSMSQKTSTEIDEEGAVVAVATAIVGATSSFYEFGRLILDRPFLYFLRNTVTGSIIIAGRVNNLPNAY